MIQSVLARPVGRKMKSFIFTMNILLCMICLINSGTIWANELEGDSNQRAKKNNTIISLQKLIEFDWGKKTNRNTEVFP